MTPSIPVPRSPRVVRSVVGPRHSAALHEATALLQADSQSAYTARLDEYESPAGIWDAFPYRSQVTLVLDLAIGDEGTADATGGPVFPRDDVVSLVAGFDLSLLICSAAELPRLSLVLSSVLAARVHILDRAVVDPRWFVAALQGLWNRPQAAESARRHAVDSLTFQRLRSLPLVWHRWLLSALSLPAEWNAVQLAAACGVQPRTLERAFAKAGLESPGRLLHEARRRLQGSVPATSAGADSAFGCEPCGS